MTTKNTEIEFYPMPSFPTLAVRDLAASSQWYQQVMGFQLVFEMPGQSGAPILIHLRWAKYADLLLVADTSQTSETKGAGVTLNFAMGQNSIDDFAAEIRRNGANIINGPVDQPWNARELTVLDEDGYRLTFTQPIDMQMSMDAVVENVKQGSI